MHPILQLKLLGGFHAARGDEPLRTLDPPRLQGLLACLAIRCGIPQQRHRLAFTFWPDSTEAQARTNLRQLLHRLRHALPDHERFIQSDRRAVFWRPEAPAVVDTIQLEAAWRQVDAARERGDSDRAIVAARRAAGLYGGDLLPECYEEWIEADRRRLKERTRAGLIHLIDLLESRRRYAEALPHVDTLLRIDPLREESHRTRIRLYALTGEPALAARAYEECAAMLERETGRGPSPETRALKERVAPAGTVVIDTPATGSRTELTVIGRHGEWRSLVGAWKRSAAGESHVMLVRGEAGIGKSRLAEALVEWAERQGVCTARSRCYMAEGLLPYGPITQWLRGGLRSRLERIDAVWRRELARLLPELAEKPSREEGAEPWRRTRLFEALARAAIADGEPTLLLLDDLQWCDGDSLELLHYLLRYDRSARILVLATLRTGEPGADPRLPSWVLQLREQELIAELPLHPLSAEETAALAREVAGTPIDADRLSSLYDETEGNPLFTVETVRSWNGPSSRLPTGWDAPSLPAKVRWVIQGRLEQLSREAGELVGVAAVIGREFSLPVLRRAAGGGSGVVRSLDELVERHIVQERSERVYDFTHDKIREVAYARLSSVRRTWLHGQVANALESTSGEPESVAGEIARHLEQSGRGVDAIPYYRKAAAHAWSILAHREAADHLRRALRLLDSVSEEGARVELELEIQTALGAALVVTDHYSGTRVWETYTRARDLCGRLGRTPTPPILRALALAALMRSRLPEVLDLARQLLRAAERDADPMLEVESHYVLGVAYYWQGRMPLALSHLERALEHYDPGRARQHLQLYAQDPSVICGVRLALALWHVGESDEAHRLVLEALARAEELAHPFSLAYARYWGVWVLIECGDIAEARSHIVGLKRDATEHGLAVWPAMAAVLEGWLRVEDGDPVGGLALMRRGREEYRALEVSLGFPYQQGLHARACRRAGRIQEALQAIDQALAMSRGTGECFWDAELYRMQGELLLERGAPAREASAPVRKALEVAREQGASALERRALATLRRLERDATEKREVHGTGQPACGRRDSGGRSGMRVRPPPDVASRPRT